MSSKPKLAIWGASGHARVVADIVRREARYELALFFSDLPYEPRTFIDLPVLSGPDMLARALSSHVTHVIIGFGKCSERLRAADDAVKNGFHLATAIHPSAVIAYDVCVGSGTVIAAGAILNPGVKIGANVIINTGAVVDHDCVIDEGTHICPGVRLAGNVAVGRAAWIGIGATVVENLRIGAYSMIGAGAVVLKDIPDAVVAVGCPARVTRNIGA